MFKPSDIVDNYISKLEAVEEGIRKLTDPVRKEMRNYSVFVDPALLERVETLAHLQNIYRNEQRAESFIFTRSHVYSPRTGLTGAAVQNIIMNPIYLWLDDPRTINRPVNIKLSSKTMHPEMNVNMADYWTWVARSLCRQDVVPSLYQVILHSGLLSTEYTALLTGFWEGPVPEFINDLTRIVISDPFEGPMVTNPAVTGYANKYHPLPTLDMKSTYYIARCDERAFYVDRSPIRSLIAAIVQVLYQGPKSLRKELSTNDTTPLVGKNLIDREIITDESSSHLLTVGDVSSFSCGNVNSWVVVLATYLGLRMPEMKHLTRSFIVDVGGYPIECNILDVLILYLRECVFARASTPLGEFVATGGYLGVGGNMTLTCLAFALRVKDFRRSFSERIDLAEYPIIRLGGDDYFVSVTGKLEVVLLFQFELEASITRFAGAIKGSERLILQGPMNTEFRKTGLTFCKKELWVKGVIGLITRQPSLYVVSLRGLPVLEEFLIPSKSKESTETPEAYASLESSIVDACTRLPFPAAASTFLLDLFRNINPSLTIPAVRRYDYYRGRLNLVFYDRWVLSVGAHNRVATASAVTTKDGVEYYNDEDTKVVRLLRQEALVTRKVRGLNRLDSSDLAVIRESDSRMLHRVQVPNALLRDYGLHFEMDRVVSILEALRGLFAMAVDLVEFRDGDDDED